MSEIISESFNKMLTAVHKTKGVIPFKGTLIAFDPGETTGYSVWQSGERGAILVEQGQIKTWPMEDAVHNVGLLYERFRPEHVVHEMYAVYEWKTDDHAWSQIPTVQVIGCMITLCILNAISYTSQTAQVAKNWSTDSKLETWGYYLKGQRHARDAVRHGTYYLLFRPQ